MHSARVGSSVKQSTRLNLGSHFDLPQDQWAALAARIDQLVRGQGSLVESSLCDAARALAQRYAAQRSAGVEHAALSVMRQCGLEDKLRELGLNRPQIAAAVGNIMGRIVHPGSELATHAWLAQRSALGELMDFNFEAMDLNRLYRASDALCKLRVPAAQPGLCRQRQ